VSEGVIVLVEVLAVVAGTGPVASGALFIANGTAEYSVLSLRASHIFWEPAVMPCLIM
jgi:hypothetical protein